MTLSADSPEPVAVVCGSGSLVGFALVACLQRLGWEVVTIDPPGIRPHPDAAVRMQGKIWEGGIWTRLQAHLSESGLAPTLFVHALSGFDASETERNAGGFMSGTFAFITESARLGVDHVRPLMPRDRGAVVFVTSVLAGWDVRAGEEAFSASQAALLGLSRSQALAAGPTGIRVNAVCVGAVSNPELPDGGVSPEVWERIPLGVPASPDDVVDAILFLASDDARHISGSSLVVDGGQSLQSWSNAPRGAGYRPVRANRPADGRAAHSFVDRTVVITGAGGGLGSAAARRFGAEGADLALLDRDLATVEQLAAELHRAHPGKSPLAIAVDVADEESMTAAFASVEEHFGRIDVLFNNAGIGSCDLSVAAMSPQEWDEVIAINLRGVFLGCHIGVPALTRVGGGAIVNMGSSTGRNDTITGGAAYMASKAAVEALTKSLALQVAPHGIRANTICPGIIQTQLSFRQQERGDEERFFAEFARRIPLGRVGQPDDVASAVAFLASDRARHITGASLLIDGGQTLRRWISAPDSR